MSPFPSPGPTAPMMRRPIHPARSSIARAICPMVAETSDHIKMVSTRDAARRRPSASVGFCPAKRICTQAARAQLKKIVIKDAPQYQRKTKSQVLGPQWGPPAGRMPKSAKRKGRASAAAPIALRQGKPVVSCRCGAAGNFAKPNSTSCKKHTHFSLDSQSQIAIYLIADCDSRKTPGNTSAAERVIIEE